MHTCSLSTAIRAWYFESRRVAQKIPGTGVVLSVQEESGRPHDTAYGFYDRPDEIRMYDVGRYEGACRFRQKGRNGMPICQFGRSKWVEGAGPRWNQQNNIIYERIRNFFHARFVRNQGTSTLVEGSGHCFWV